MAATPSVMHAILLEQTERTRKSSKADVQRFIEESELKIASLELQIAHERACVAALRHIFSPIHTLPVELLAEIFDLAILEQRRVWDRQWRWDALRISQVCSYWRQVAHSTPRLWTRPIVVDIGLDRTGGREQVYADGLKIWLQRSVPLAVPVTLLLGYESSNNRVPDEVLSTVPRWRSLRLDVSNNPPLSFVQQLSEGSFDSLEELDLAHHEDFSTAVSTTSISFTVPRLRKLRIKVWSEVLRTDILMPWAQLTDLSLNSCYPNIILDILTQCPSLAKTTVFTNGWAVPPTAGQDILALGHLRVLNLRFLGEVRHFLPILDRLAAPELEKLDLDFQIASAVMPWTQTCFTAFQLRAPNIAHLILGFSYLTSDDLRTAIHHAPSLTHLQIESCEDCIDDELLDALHYKAGVSPLAPHLHDLLLDDVGNNFTEDTLAGMIVSRWWTAPKLTSLPAVSRWTRVQLCGMCGSFGEHFIDMVKDLPSDVLSYERRRY